MDKTVALYMRLSDEDDNLAAHEESNSISHQRKLMLDHIQKLPETVYLKTDDCKEKIYMKRFIIAKIQSKDIALNRHLMIKVVKKQWYKKETILHLMEKRMTGVHLQNNRRSFIEMQDST